MTEREQVYFARLRAEKRRVVPTGMTRRNYAEIIARCLSRYHRVNDLRSITPDSVESTLQSFSRVVCSMAVLCADGDVTRFSGEDASLFSDHSAFLSRFEECMTLACDAISRYAGKDVFNFSVKELMLAYLLTREQASPASRLRWEEGLRSIRPTADFYSHAERTTNRNVYLAAGEQLRTFCGLADSADFIDGCWERQRRRFNARGMYLDNFKHDPTHNPLLYDLTTRVQLQLLRGCGYRGRYADELDCILRRGGLNTLFLQSAAFEMPYGGRSNQFLFNEALISANCEYEARHYLEHNDPFTAGVFKRAAHLAVASIMRWLTEGKHIKNFYTDASVGTEGYGNYDKYMATLSSFLAIAYLFAGESDECVEQACPAECGGYLFSETENFHVTVAGAGGYSIQLMTDADLHYDAVGLGRLHKCGIPTELAVSLPFTATPAYTPDPAAALCNASLDVGWRAEDGSLQLLADYIGLNAAVETHQESAERVSFTVRYSGGRLPSWLESVTEAYELSAQGLRICAELSGQGTSKLLFAVPLLISTGDMPPALHPLPERISGETVVLRAGAYVYTLHTDAESAEFPTSPPISNRNGCYRLLLLHGKGRKMKLHLTLEALK